MTTSVLGATLVGGDLLAATLHHLGVSHLGKPRRDTELARLEPVELLAGLASSDEARLRMAIVPLLLWCPEISLAASEASAGLHGRAQLTLMCYATAAAMLQHELLPRLIALRGIAPEVPDTFAADLRLKQSGDHQIDLQALAARHAELSGEALNWLGTYRHAAESLLNLKERERERAWTK